MVEEAPIVLNERQRANTVPGLGAPGGLAAGKSLAFKVRIERVLPGGSELRTGYESAAMKGVVVVGRQAGVGFQLADTSVSRSHARVTLTAAGFDLTNLSAHGATFVNGRRLAHRAQITLDKKMIYLQVGRVLLCIFADPDTLEISQMIELPEVERGEGAPPLIALRSIGSNWSVQCRGHIVKLFPSAARVLARLCEEPGEVVPHDALEQAIDPESHQRVGGATIAQNITYVRKFFAEAIEMGWLEPEVLLGWIKETGEQSSDSDDIEGFDQSTLLRLVVENHRRVGYRLRIPAREIVFT